MSKFPVTRFALTRFFVLLAMRACPADAWAYDRLHGINKSLKRTISNMTAPEGKP